MKTKESSNGKWTVCAVVVGLALVFAIKSIGGPTSYAPVATTKDFKSVMADMKAEKSVIMKRQMDLLAERYDLRNMSARDVKMSGGKAVQKDVRVKLPEGMTWQELAGMTPDQIRQSGVLPKGFLPLPHPNHPPPLGSK